MEKSVDRPGFVRRWHGPAAVLLVFAASAAAAVAIEGPRRAGRVVIQPAVETHSRGRGVVEVISGEAADGTRVHLESPAAASTSAPAGCDSTG
jgi:hypothetical protein